MSEATTPAPLRVFLVDDHAMFRTGVRAELGGLVTEERGAEEGGGPATIEVVGEASTVADAVRQIVALTPDVVLLDVHMPDGGGRAVLEQVREQLGTGAAAKSDASAPAPPLAPASDKAATKSDASAPPAAPAETSATVRFLALSVSDAAEDVIGLIRAGARGYVTKSISSEELAAAIRRVADGDAVFSPRLAGFVLDAFAAHPDVPLADPELDQLTTREREVLRLLARGYAYKEIAKELFISIKTVETHVSNVLRKLQMSNRYELSRWAADRRLV